MLNGRDSSATMTLLGDERVVVAGCTTVINGAAVTLASAELYMP
jgi:hypothetical protein